MNQYLMLDKGERVPLKISLHLLGCKKCREQIKLLKLAEKEISAPLKIETPVTDASIQKIISQIHVQQKDRFYKPLPFAGWIIGGILMIALLFSSLFSTQDIQNRSLSIWYALTIAGCVTVYCAVRKNSGFSIGRSLARNCSGTKIFQCGLELARQQFPLRKRK